MMFGSDDVMEHVLGDLSDVMLEPTSLRLVDFSSKALRCLSLRDAMV